MKTPLSMSGNVIHETALLLALVSAQTLTAQIQVPPTAPNTTDTNKVVLSPVAPICLLEAWTNQVAVGSSNFVGGARFGGWISSSDRVYLTGWAKTPGAYEYRKGMTVSELIAAGGLRPMVGPSARGPIYFFPDSTSVYRTTAKNYPAGDVNRFKRVFQFKLRDPADGGARGANFELEPGDDVVISMAPCLQQTLSTQLQTQSAAPSMAETDKAMLSPVPAIVLLEAWTNQVADGGGGSYGSMVRFMDSPDHQHSVCIYGWVKIQGAYQYREGITVADLVAAASGLRRDVRDRNNPKLYIVPQCILVFRVIPPVYTARNPFIPFKFDLDDSADGGICKTNFVLKAGDDVYVSTSPCLP